MYPHKPSLAKSDTTLEYIWGFEHIVFKPLYFAFTAL